MTVVHLFLCKALAWSNLLKALTGRICELRNEKNLGLLGKKQTNRKCQKIWCWNCKIYHGIAHLIWNFLINFLIGKCTQTGSQWFLQLSSLKRKLLNKKNGPDNLIPPAWHSRSSADYIKAVTQNTTLALWWSEPAALYPSLKHRLPQPHLEECTGMVEGDGSLLQPPPQPVQEGEELCQHNLSHILLQEGTASLHATHVGMTWTPLSLHQPSSTVATSYWYSTCDTANPFCHCFMAFFFCLFSSQNSSFP